MKKLGQALMYITLWLMAEGLFIFGFMQMTVYR